ncbi:10 TMS drug/metabolite efflux pump (DME) family protein [Shewanella litoralis]|uniref:10 TMS drug/metabolite efflux pump (DME) family protein n=1 Tax=Shewanella litoralis TaxID=2282700 RepID=A0ABQ2R6F6_9GAMM|nr:DMT family transporter [Shewanella litoralis]GGQ14942.1 10 TMS drug/metabolite efflux pump (DME) family protein [Shewanella litoralis]
MTVEQQSANNRLGLIFVSIAVFFWGILPIALKLSGGFITPVTLTWFRFLMALVVTLLIQWKIGALRQFVGLPRAVWLKLTLAGVLLMCNYVSFVYSLSYLAPGTAQLNFQTAPFFLAFGGVLFFKERFTAFQLSCFATLALGMLMFFHPQLDMDQARDEQVLIGIMIVQFSVMSWTSYALLQKSVSQRLSPSNVLLFIYGLGIVAMAPFSDFSQFNTMTLNQWWIVLFCGANTLIAYGCFAQALHYWPTAQVSAMLSLTPVLSFTATEIVVSLGWWSGVFSSANIDGLSFMGIVLIVCAVFAVQIVPMYQKRKQSKAFRTVL